MQLTGAQMICESLIHENVDLMFGLPGGAILPFYQTLPEYPQLRHILVRHEQNAGHAADAYARVSGKVGVAVATSGPGATNLVTPLATAMMDSVPMVAITGQVPRAAIGRDAFQETDTTGITVPVTKHNYLVMHVNDIPNVMKEAFHVARSGRPGPVLIDVPRDVLTDEGIFHYPETVNLRSFKISTTVNAQMIKRAVRLIKDAERPLLLVGHGASISGAFTEVKLVAEKAQIPVISTLLGIGALHSDHPLNMGMPGMHGPAYNNWAIERADLIIGVGMRFDDRVTGRISTFAPNAKVIHIDIDPAEIGKNVRVTVPLLGDAKIIMDALASEIEAKSNSLWLDEIETLKAEHPLSINSDYLSPQYVIKALSDITSGDAIVVTGVGQHQMWAAQHYAFNQPNSWITSGGLGTMGFEVPGAIGAAFAKPDRQVWSIAGDGGFQMTMSELATIVENNISVKFAILNNNNLGLVRQLQDLFYGGLRVASSYSGNPNFVKLAEAYGIWAKKIETQSEVIPALREAMSFEGPAILDFHVNAEENVYPHVPAGESVLEMIDLSSVKSEQ